MFEKVPRDENKNTDFLELGEEEYEPFNMIAVCDFAGVENEFPCESLDYNQTI